MSGAAGQRRQRLVVGVACPRQRKDAMVREDHRRPVSAGERRAVERVAHRAGADADQPCARRGRDHEPRSARRLDGSSHRRPVSRCPSAPPSVQATTSSTRSASDELQRRRRRGRGRPAGVDLGGSRTSIVAATAGRPVPTQQLRSPCVERRHEVERRQRGDVGHLGVRRAVETAGELDDDAPGFGDVALLDDASTNGRRAVHGGRAVDGEHGQVADLPSAAGTAHRRDV